MPQFIGGYETNSAQDFSSRPSTSATVVTPATNPAGTSISTSLASDTHLWAIVDPEVARENPVEDKHRRLIRSHRSSPHDRGLKPNAKIRDELAKILNYAPSQPLNSEEKDQIWKFRFYLSRDKRGLTKFLKSVTWRDQSEVKQAVEELLPQWTEIDIDDALELLGPGTVDSRVRAYAVKQLNRADDDELLLYLLQLVQALKFESTASDQRSSRITSSAISYEDSGLADFLISRAVKNPILSNRFHWYLMVEVADQVMAKMYGRVIYKFQQKIAEVRCVNDRVYRVTHGFRLAGRRRGTTRVDEATGTINRGVGKTSKGAAHLQGSAAEENRKASSFPRRLEEQHVFDRPPTLTA